MRTNVLVDRQIFFQQRHGGVSRYFAELIRGIGAHPEWDVDIHTDFRWSPNEYLPTIETAKFRRIPMPGGTGFSARLARKASAARGRRLSGSLRAADVLHLTNYDEAVLGETGTIARVVTVYDMIHELLPDEFDPTPDKRACIEASSAIICISETTKADLEAYFGPMGSKPILVTPLAAGPEFRPEGIRCEPGFRYVLFVGRREGYKNFRLLIDAYAESTLPRSNVHLVCIGGGDFSTHEKEVLHSHGLEGLAHQRRVEDERIAAWYRGAEAFICPSLYEGFGLPTVEAMASGCPVILASTPALTEVAGDAARYFPPGDTETLVASLTDVIHDLDLRRAMALRSVRRASQFTWAKTAAATAGLYRELSHAR